MPEIVTLWPMLIVWAVFGYLVGSVPFGIIVTRAMGLGDLRKIGSGNIGATNVLRTGNKGAALATLLLDSGKGAVVVLAVRAMAAEDAVQIAALAAFVGHCLPVWLGFHGGKGVATLLGILLALNFVVGAAACATWLVVAVLSRYSSLAALMAAGFTPIWAALLQEGQVVLLCIAFALLVYWRHGANIARLRAGTEPKIGLKKT